MDEFQRMLATELQGAGYYVNILKPQLSKNALLERYDGSGNEVDEYLDFTVGAKYMCYSSNADYKSVRGLQKIIKCS